MLPAYTPLPDESTKRTMNAGQGMKMDEEKQRVAAAKHAISEAQRDVTEAIGEIAAAARADKRHASDGLTTALDRLRAAQTELTRLEELLTPLGDDPKPAT